MINIIYRYRKMLFLVVVTIMCGNTQALAQNVTYITPDQLSPTATTAFKIEADGIYVLAAINEGTGLPDPAAAPTTFDGFIQIINGKNVTLYLNGHTLTCSKSKKIIESKGNLTLYGTYPGGNEGGIIDGYNATNSSIKNCAIYQTTSGMSTVIDGITIQNCNYGSAGGAIYNVSGTGTLQISNTTIKDCKSSGNGGAIYCDNIASVTIDNVTIQRCSGTGGGAIYKNRKSELMTVSNSLIEDCTASSHGGGIYFTDYTAGLELTNTTIRNCESKGNGGGIYSAGKGIVTFKNKSIISNCAALNNKGGGIYIGGSGKLTMEDGSLIQQCFANTGGGVYVATSGIFTMDGGTIEYCYAVKDRETDFVKDGDPAGEGYVGGGVCMLSSTMNFNGGTIQYCHAGTGSGGIHTWYGDARAYLYINGPTCKVTHCDAYSYGGCTHVGNGSYCVMKDGEISYNTCHHGSINENGGAFSVGFATGSRFDIEGGKICHNQALAEDGGIGLGGGIFMRQSGSTGGAIKITGGEISDNYAANKGGGVYARISVKVDGASILRNEAGVDGGGIFFENTCSYFKFLSGEISGNTAGNNGGGLYFDNFGSNSIELIQGTLADNTAGNYGGGAYMVNSKITFGTGTDLFSFEGNSAVQGGGLYISSTGTSTARNVTINNSNFIGNTASDCGGGIYLADNGKGTLYLKQGGTYSSNTAVNNGGAIYVYNTKNVNITNGNFSMNEANNGNGGGVYIGTGEVLIEGGIFKKNRALSGNGGGIYVGKSSDVTMSNGDIADNQAKNGGGIYLAPSAHMTMTNGLIRYNKAVSAHGETIPTAYHAGNDSSIQGVGGGIYLSSETTTTVTKLEFKMPETIGIYGNTATLGADDIFADGSNSQINVPKIEGMNLTEYSATVDGWYEDYITDDTHYADGTNIAPEGTPVRRYEDYIANKESTYIVPNEIASVINKYICLRLGYTPLTDNLIIIKSGMTKGETAIFKVWKTDAESQILYTVSITAGDDGSGSVTIKDIPIDEYTVQEEAWSWAYISDALEGKITQNLNKNNKFKFVNTLKDGIPLHDEAYKDNDLNDYQ